MLSFIVCSALQNAVFICFQRLSLPLSTLMLQSLPADSAARKLRIRGTSWSVRCKIATSSTQGRSEDQDVHITSSGMIAAKMRAGLPCSAVKCMNKENR